MDLMDKLGDQRSQMKAARTTKKLEGAEERKSELESENRILRDELDRTDRLQSRLDELVERSRAKKPRRIRWMVAGSLVTWAFGTETGRRQISRLADKVMEREPARDLRSRAEQAAGRIADRAQEVTDAAQTKVQDVTDKVQDATGNAKPKS
ncbi:MAG TPA: hypothetical protein VGH10_00115 [Actinomycetota bacterium]|jgi:hypothetical protein